VFDRQEKDLDYVEKLTRKDFVEFTERILYSEKKKFEFHSVCPPHQQENSILREKRLKNEEIVQVLHSLDFKKERNTYPDFYSYHKI
jgi:secreted Zn-dependent insulinase-like peptidase